MERKKISTHLFNLNLFSGELLRGALLCVGNMQKHNCMTISWATMGVLWNRHIFVVYVRPTRYTFGLINSYPDFTVNFFSAECRDKLAYCGTVSGRDVDKFAEAGLSVVASQKVDSPSVDESHLIIEARTIYAQDLDPRAFVDPRINDHYPRKDYHRMFMGEIAHISGVAEFLA